MKHRILIVDDDVDITALLRRWLERDGHDVDDTRDGPSGLRLALNGPYDLAFIDIGLPALDGYEIARKVRATRVIGRPCLVALTANTDEPDQAFAAGFDAHVLKPVEEKTIAAVLEQMPSMMAAVRGSETSRG